jgi:MFS family permease
MEQVRRRRGVPVRPRLPRLRGALWHEPEFLKLWAAQTVSVFGDQISLLAIPLVAVLTLDASAAEMGLLTAAAWAPHLLFSLPAGLWVDRAASRRRVMIVADVARALVLATVPIAVWLDLLTIAQLLAVAFAIGALTVMFDVASGAFFLRVVRREDAVEAQSKMMVSRSASYIAGPSLAGFLVQVATAPLALLADAFSFLGSAAFLRRLRTTEPPPEPPNGESVAERLAGGFRFVLGNPVLRAGIGCTSTINFFNLAFNAILILYLADELGLEPGLIGIVFGVGAVGALVGAFVAAPLGRRLGIGPAIVAGSVLFPLGLLLFPLARGPEALVVALLLVGEFVAGVGVMLFDVNQNSLMLLVTPDRMRPRQMATSRFFNYGVRPLGALFGGLLATVIGLRAALWLTGVATLAGVLWLWFSPVRTLHELPQEADG